MELKLKFFNPNKLERNIKATVHKTGKIGFTVEAADKLKLSVDKFIGIAVNEENDTDDNLYMVVTTDKQSGFKVGLAGDYFYVNTKLLFDNLKLNYKTESIVYDITEDIFDGNPLFILKRREKIEKELPLNQ